MRALKWAAGLALGNDPDDGSPPFGSRARRAGSLVFHQQVDDEGTSAREDSEGELGR